MKLPKFVTDYSNLASSFIEKKKIDAAEAARKAAKKALGDIKASPRNAYVRSHLKEASFTFGLNKTAKEYLHGGKADHVPDGAFEKRELKKGTKHEKEEHTKNKAIAKEIAKDHIVEDKKYYEHLEKMEKKAMFNSGFEKIAKELTTAGRKHISEDNFALPGRRYPIHDKAHARNALARVAQHGTPDEQAKVKAAVHRKFPNIGEE